MSDHADRRDAAYEGCTCQGCGTRYRVDVMVPDALWEEIRPIGTPAGSGLLCGVCIASRIEQRGRFDAYSLRSIG